MLAYLVWFIDVATTDNVVKLSLPFPSMPGADVDVINADVDVIHLPLLGGSTSSFLKLSSVKK